MAAADQARNLMNYAQFVQSPQYLKPGRYHARFHFKRFVQYLHNVPEEYAELLEHMQREKAARAGR